MSDPKTGGVVGEAARMNNVADKSRRSKSKGPKVDRDMSIQARFQRFHEKNPDVYVELVRLARRLRSQGITRYGIVGLYEVLRYDNSLRTSGKPFKLTNDFRSRYARLIMDKNEDLANFFTTRELTSL